MITDVFKRVLLAGLGLMSVTEDKLKEVIKDMESKGEVSKKEGEEIVKSILSKAEEEKKTIENRIAEVIKDSLKKINIATREEVVKLEKKVHSLEKKVKELMQEKEE
ncbi:MAG: phasin family protein [Deltaproteobacteria bacterium]|nr:phasin family protein [Deltaproteobacteria bacterium]